MSKDRKRWVRASEVKGLEFAGAARPSPHTESHPPRTFQDDSGAAPGAAPKPAAGESPCPGCAAPMAAGAVLCIQCGYHLKSGSRLETTRESGVVRLELREDIKRAMGLLGGIVAFLGFLLTFGLFAGEAAVGLVGLVMLVAGTLAVVTAFLARHHFAVVRQGGARHLQKQIELGPVTFFTRKIDLSPYQEVWFVQAPKPSMAKWLLVVMLLLLCFGIIPGIIWWIVLLRAPDENIYYRTELRGPGGASLPVFKGGEWARHDADEVARLLKRAGGLRLEQELGLLS